MRGHFLPPPVNPFFKIIFTNPRKPKSFNGLEFHCHFPMGIFHLIRPSFTSPASASTKPTELQTPEPTLPQFPVPFPGSSRPEEHPQAENSSVSLDSFCSSASESSGFSHVQQPLQPRFCCTSFSSHLQHKKPWSSEKEPWNSHRNGNGHTRTSPTTHPGILPGLMHSTTAGEC